MATRGDMWATSPRSWDKMTKSEQTPQWDIEDQPLSREVDERTVETMILFGRIAWSIAARSKSGQGKDS